MYGSPYLPLLPTTRGKETCRAVIKTRKLDTTSLVFPSIVTHSSLYICMYAGILSLVYILPASIYPSPLCP